MCRIAVCDDDHSITEQLRETIRQINPTYHVQLFHDGKTLIDSVQLFDVLFLDIDMPDMNGIETAKRIREVNKSVKIIYLTSYADYVHYAFSVHAFAYLLKPFTKEMIEKQLKEVQEYKEESIESNILRFDTVDGVEEIATKDIYYFEYIKRSVKIVTKQQMFTMREGIHTVAERMEPFGFFMPHKSFSVNLYHVKAIKGYDIVMMNGDTIPLSQKKSSAFRTKLSSFHASQI